MTQGKDSVQAMQERIVALIEEHSQAEVARKTSTNRSTVSKYIHGMKIPLEFGQALVDALGVNPAWLLTGEGAKYLSEVTADTSETAANALELVQAMNAVMKKRLGELLGKDHLMKLRELDEALQAYDGLRTQMNARFTPIYTKLLDDMSKAIENDEIDRTRALHTAVQQLGRFCDDKKLAFRAAGLEATLLFHLGDVDTAMTIEGRRFAQILFDPAATDDDRLHTALHHIWTLYYGSRIRDGMRYCRATLGMYEDLPKSGEAGELYDAIALFLGLMEIDGGLILRGLTRLQELYPRLRDLAYRNMYYGAQIRALYFAGGVPAEGVFGLASRLATNYGPHEFTKVACWEEREDVLRNAGTVNISIVSFGQTLSNSILKVIDGQPDEALLELNEFLKSYVKREVGHVAKDVIDFLVKLARACVLGHSPDRTAFLEAVERADKALRAVPDKITVDIFWVALHSRNVLRAFSDDADSTRAATRARAQDWFDDIVAKGYVRFQPYTSDTVAATLEAERVKRIEATQSGRARKPRKTRGKPATP